MWLYIPGNKPTSPSTPVEVDSISASDSRIQMLSRSYTWNESYRQPRSWLTTLKRDSWMQHLFGLIPEPSTANRLLTKWIGSLAASPASRSASPASSEEPRTNAGSGTISGDWLLRYDPDTSSWRTRQVSLFTAELEPFSATFPRSGSMMLNGQVFERRMSVRPIAGNASSSWPTARAAEAKGVAYQYDQGDHNKPRLSLTGEAENWPTARANDPEKRGDISNDPRHGLPAIAQHWATPVADEVKSGTRNHQGRSLNKEVHTWATPTASDDEHKVTVNSLQPGLVGEVDRFSGRPVQEALKIGGKLSKSDQPSLPRLNPLFVEWMMGWPQGWLELTGSASSGTEWSLPKPAMPITY